MIAAAAETQIAQAVIAADEAAKIDEAAQVVQGSPGDAVADDGQLAHSPPPSLLPGTSLGPRRAGIGGYSPPKQAAALFEPGAFSGTRAAADWAAYRGFVGACKAGASRKSADRPQPAPACAAGGCGRPSDEAASWTAAKVAAQQVATAPKSPQRLQRSVLPPTLSASPIAATPQRWSGRRSLTKLNLYQFWASLLLTHPHLSAVLKEFTDEALADARAGKGAGDLAAQVPCHAGVRTDQGATWVVRFLYTACSRSAAGREVFYARFEGTAVQLYDEFGFEYGLEKLWRYHRAPAAATPQQPEGEGALSESALVAPAAASAAAPESASRYVLPRAAELVAKLSERFASRQFHVATPSMALGAAMGFRPGARAAVTGSVSGHPGAIAPRAARRHFYVPGRGRVLSAPAAVCAVGATAPLADAQASFPSSAAMPAGIYPPAAPMPYVPPHMSAQSVAAMAAARASGAMPHAVPVYMPGAMGGTFLVPRYDYSQPAHAAASTAAQHAAPAGYGVYYHQHAAAMPAMHGQGHSHATYGHFSR